ncbi:HNH endonuclease [Tautonia plasticadhaerens]|uniref:HNH endonuclease n=1 Tax=Tautonia plasticadhaerens TaxID=2527974 RepID=UPI0018D25018|nr:HNH endonuclease [Tautonia plasticadhaerens]
MTETWRPLKPIRKHWGHLTVNLHRDGIKRPYYIHRLVLEAFVGPQPPGMLCCHWDGNPANNNIDNLRWDTPKANGADTIRHGRRKFGEQAGSKLKEAEVLEVRRLFAEGVSMTKLGASFGVSQPMISYIVKGLAWRHLLPDFDPMNPI